MARWPAGDFSTACECCPCVQSWPNQVAKLSTEDPSLKDSVHTVHLTVRALHGEMTVNSFHWLFLLKLLWPPGHPSVSPEGSCSQTSGRAQRLCLC